MKKHDDKMIGKLYMRLLPVQIILVIIAGVNNIIDSTFASNMIGPDAMAVVGLFLPVLNLINALNVLFSGGAQIMCGKYLGKNMIERTKSVFTIDMVAVTGITAIMVIICEVIPMQVAGVLGAKGEFCVQLASYIRGFVIGLIPLMLGTQLTAFLQIEQQEKRTYAAIGGMLASNVLFNYMFIAVWNMGLFGLGLSTSISNIVFFIIQATYYFTGKSVVGISLKKIVLADLKDILKNGFPQAITQLCIMIRSVIINYLIRDYVGPDGLATFSAVMTFGNLYWSVAAGVTSAVTMLASVYVGEENKESLRSLMRVFVKRGLVFVAAASAVYMAFCVPLTNIFYRDPNSTVYSMTVMGFLLFPISTPISATVVGFTNYIHCLGTNEGFMRFTALFDGAIGPAGMAVIFIPSIGMMGTWIAQIAGGVVLILILLGFVIYKNKRFPRSGEDMMCFPKDFGVSSDNRIDLTVYSMEEALEISEAISDFCRSHGSPSKICNRTALCVEEMVKNIITHGFVGKKKHHIDMSVTYVNEGIVVSIKDDCKAFNPKEAAELFDSEDKTHNIGLRLISGIAREMKYQNTFGLNVLTIVI